MAAYHHAGACHPAAPDPFRLRGRTLVYGDLREAELIAKSAAPQTRTSLSQAFLDLGVQPGSVLLVHSSLSKLGWVCGGPVAVILALEDALGETGTLVMPTHSGDNSDPALWSNPPVPAEWVEIIRASMPAFDGSIDPHAWDGAHRRDLSFAGGCGAQCASPIVFCCPCASLASQITAQHMIEKEMGEGSPLQKIYDLDGWILLLGVGHANNTSLHLAEYRSDFPGKKTVRQGCAVSQNGKAQWIEFEGLDFNDARLPRHRRGVSASLSRGCKARQIRSVRGALAAPTSLSRFCG